MLSLGFQTFSLNPSRSLRKLQQELCYEDDLNEALRTEPFCRMTLLPQSPQQALAARRRSSSFTEMPILDRRRRSEDDGVDKRVRRSVEVLATLPEDCRCEPHVRKHIVWMSE